MIRQIAAHTEGITSLQCDPTGNVLCSTSSDKCANLWDLRSFCSVGSLKGHTDTVNYSIFCNDGNTLITCSDDKTVAVWDSRLLAEPTLVIRGFRDGVNKFLLSEVDNILCVVSAVDDGYVYINKAHDGSLHDCFWAATNTLNDLLLDPSDNTILLTCSEDCSIRTWRLGELPPRVENKLVVDDDSYQGPERLIASLDEFENPVNHIALHDGWLFAACAECIFSTEYTAGGGQFGSSARGFSCHSDYVRGVEFFGDTMYTTSDDATVVEWCTSTCEPRRQLKVHDTFTMAMTMTRGLVSDAQRTLVTGCEDGNIRFWSLPFVTEPFA
jgi:WD40 repeat protein